MAADQLQLLLQLGEDKGCINLSQFSEVAQELELDEEELAGLYEQLEERGIELTDDCARDRAPARRRLRERRARRDDDRRAPALPQRGRPLPAADGRARRSSSPRASSAATSARRSG